MSDIQSSLFLRLLKASFDVGSNVLRIYADQCVIIPDYSGSFIRCLDKNKHTLYHLWQSNYICCGCESGFTQRKKEMQDWIFNQLYEIRKNTLCSRKRHNGMTCSGRSQCLCKVIPIQTLSVHELDIPVVAFLLKNIKPENHLNPAIEDISTIRNRLCHALSTTSYLETDLDMMWKTLENAIELLVKDIDKSTRQIVQQQLLMTRTHCFGTEEVKSFLSEVFESFSKELIQNENNNNSALKIALEKNLSDLTTKLDVLKEGQASISREVKDEGVKVRQHTSEETNRILNVLGTLTDTVEHLKMNFTFKCCKHDDQIGENTAQADLKINADLNEEQTIETLNANREDEKNNDSFKLITAEKGCILLKINIGPKVLKNEEAFMNALRSLTGKIIKAGKIDTTEDRTIDIEFTFTSPLTPVQRRVLHSILKNRGNDNISSEDYGHQIKSKLESHSEQKTEIMEKNKKADVQTQTTEFDVNDDNDADHIFDDRKPRFDERFKASKQDSKGKTMAEGPWRREHRRQRTFNLGVIGRSNSGKSTLIKALIQKQKITCNTLPETDFLEKTDTCSKYEIKDTPLVLWDVPGCGTQDVSVDGYDKKINMDRYDGFLVCCSGPITEYEWALNNLIGGLGRRYFFIRTKIDSALESDKKAHPSSFSEEQTLKKIRTDIHEKLSENGVTEFLVSSRCPEKFDFENLNFMLFGEGWPFISACEHSNRKVKKEDDRIKKMESSC